MNRLFIILLFTTMSYASTPIETVISFASETEAISMLTSEDSFTMSWSDFDVDARVGHKNATKKELFTFIKEQVRAWTKEEEAYILTIIKEIDLLVEAKGYSLPIPDSLFLLKTTQTEEGGATAYTRANYIVFNDAILDMDRSKFKKLFLHELFHIISRNDTVFRAKMYEIIGFSVLENNIEYPESIASLRITNPDAIQTDTYIHLRHKGLSKPFMMVLYAKSTYKGGSFFDYLKIAFMELDVDNTIKMDSIGKPSLLEMSQVSGFFEKIGKNTNYIIHPEEIIADNFSFLLMEYSVKDQFVLEGIKKVLLTY